MDITKLCKGCFQNLNSLDVCPHCGYTMVTGIVPEEPLERFMEETLCAPHAIDPAIPKAISDIIIKAMALKRRHRFSSVKRMENAIKNPCNTNQRGRKVIDNLSVMYKDKFAGTLIKGCDFLSDTIIDKGLSEAAGGLYSLVELSKDLPLELMKAGKRVEAIETLMSSESLFQR